MIVNDTTTRVALSAPQQKFLADIRAELARIQDRLNVAVTAIVAGSLDLTVAQTHTIEVAPDGTAILCTPPAASLDSGGAPVT